MTKKVAQPPKPRRAAGKSGAWRHVNRVQLGVLMGVHPDTITDYARSGMPVKTAGGRGRQSVYDAVACLEWWRSQQGKNAKEAAQTRAYEATAQLNELKLSLQRGELVSREDAVLAGQAYTKAWAAIVRGWPHRLLTSGLITRDQMTAAAIISRDVLLEISNWNTVADARLALAETA